jgi:hypothetical protein
MVLIRIYHMGEFEELHRASTTWKVYNCIGTMYKRRREVDLL